MDVHLIYPLDYSWAQIVCVLEAIGIYISKDKSEAFLTLFSETSRLSHTQYVETTCISFNSLPHSIGVLLFFLPADNYLGEAVLARNIGTFMLLPSRLFVIDPSYRRQYYPTHAHASSVVGANLSPIPTFRLPDDTASLKCSICLYLELVLHKQALPDVAQSSSLCLLVWEWIRRYEEAAPNATVESVRHFGRLVGENLQKELISDNVEVQEQVQVQLTTLATFARGILHGGCTNTSMTLGHCTLKEYKLQIFIYVRYRPATFQVLLGHMLASICWSFMGSKEDTVVCSQDKTHLTISVLPHHPPSSLHI